MLSKKIDIITDFTLSPQDNDIPEGIVLKAIVVRNNNNSGNKVCTLLIEISALPELCDKVNNKEIGIVHIHTSMIKKAFDSCLLFKPYMTNILNSGVLFFGLSIYLRTQVYVHPDYKNICKTNIPKRLDIDRFDQEYAVYSNDAWPISLFIMDTEDDAAILFSNNLDNSSSMDIVPTQGLVKPSIIDGNFTLVEKTTYDKKVEEIINSPQWAEIVKKAWDVHLPMCYSEKVPVPNEWDKLKPMAKKALCQACYTKMEYVVKSIDPPVTLLQKKKQASIFDNSLFEIFINNPQAVRAFFIIDIPEPTQTIVAE